MAEFDPTFDVGGLRMLLMFLESEFIAYGIDTATWRYFNLCIKTFQAKDIAFAKEFEFSIKLLGTVKVGNEIELRVHPVMIPEDKMMCV